MPQPSLELYNHQEKQPVSIDLWQAQALRALPHVIAAAKSGDACLLHLDTVEISLVSDEAVAKVHGDFMNDPSPTDVITFQHGEILVSADTAHERGPEHGQTLREELALYMIHGLMHLGGWEDHEEAEAAEMTQRQEAIHRQVCDR